MAKLRSLWIRKSTQRLGGVVTYVMKGQTIGRELAASVANPRTVAQMNQRLKLANLVAFYRVSRPWMNRGAFETKKQTWSDYNAFVSKNIGFTTVALNKTEASGGACVIEPFQVTEGSLSPLEYKVSDTGTIAQIAITNLAGLGDLGVPESVGKLAEMFIQAGLAQNGDQFSLIIYRNKRLSNGLPFVSMKAIEVILDRFSTAEISDVFGFGFYDYDDEELGLQFEISHPASETLGVAMIISRTTPNGLKVSSQRVVLGNSFFADAYSTTEQWNEAVASYGTSGVNFLDSTSVQAGANSGGTNDGNDDEGASGVGDPSDVTP